MRRVAVALALAGAWLLAPISAYADPDLTALVNAAYFPRTETLHDLAHQRAQYQVTYSGGVCAENSLTHDGWITAEVLACNYSGPARAIEQWQGSPPHHAILSDPSFDQIGCATAYGVAGAQFHACVLIAGEPVAAARTPNPTPVGSIPTAGATPEPLVPQANHMLPDTATR